MPANGCHNYPHNDCCIRIPHVDNLVNQVVLATSCLVIFLGFYQLSIARDILIKYRLQFFPGIAFLIIRDPRFNLTEVGADFQYTSWRVFVAACGIPSLLVVLLLIPFPESPRYLLYANRADQALQVLQRIFVVNTKLSEKDFPVSLSFWNTILKEYAY